MPKESFDAYFTPATATIAQPYVNALGMKFVPVPIVGGAGGGQRLQKSEKIADIFPWGTAGPPPAGTGNHVGDEFRAALASGKYSYINRRLTGCRDDFDCWCAAEG